VCKIYVHKHLELKQVCTLSSLGINFHTVINKYIQRHRTGFFAFLPVTITSVRFVPNMRLVNLPAGASLPLPYDGRGSSTGHSVIS